MQGIRKKGKDLKRKPEKNSVVNAKCRITRGSETQEEASERLNNARHEVRDNLTNYDRKRVFDIWRGVPKLRDHNRKLKKNETGRRLVPTKQFLMKQIGLNSTSAFDTALRLYVETGIANPPASSSGGNTPLISPTLLKKAIKNAEYETKYIGG